VTVESVRRPRRKRPAPLVEYAYDLAYGKDSAAQAGMVMLRLAKEGTILAELNMPPEEFLQLAHAVEIVARAVDEDMKPTPNQT